MTIVALSHQNVRLLTALSVELWVDNNYEEQLCHWQSVAASEQEICYLAKSDESYIGFIHLNLRHDYVEGAECTPVAFVEAIYVKESFRKLGIASQLLLKGEEWAIFHHATQLASDAEINNIISIQFHIQTGFRETNRIVCFIKDL